MWRMWIKITLLFIFVSYSIPTISQNLLKQPLNDEAIENWQSLGSSIISETGKFVMYSVRSSDGKEKFYLTSVNTGQVQELGFGYLMGRFSKDDNFAFFLNSHDSLLLISLKNFNIKSIANVHSYKFSQGKSGLWIGYITNDTARQLLLFSVYTENKVVKQDVVDFGFFNNGESVIVQVKEGKETNSLHLLSLKTLVENEIWIGGAIRELLVQDNARWIAYIDEKQSGFSTYHSIWYYHSHLQQPIKCLNDKDSTFKILGFSSTKLFEGNKLLFYANSIYTGDVRDTAIASIWNYLEPLTLGRDGLRADPSSPLLMSICIDDRRIVYHTREGEDIVTDVPSSNRFLLVAASLRDAQPYRDKQNHNLYLLDLHSGIRVPLKCPWAVLSPDDKFLVYFDSSANQYYSYDIFRNTYKGITDKIHTDWTSPYEADKPANLKRPRGIAGWIKSTSYVLLYDRYDIWQVDLSGVKPPINLSHYIGQAKNIVFSVLSPVPEEVNTDKKKIVVAAFDMNKKENGFYRLDIGGLTEPHLLTMGPYVYYIPNNPYLPDMYIAPARKAKKASIHLVTRMSSVESPNLFVTTDFKSFLKVSRVNPESTYRWLTSELVNWSQGDINCQGLLFKPEDFDSTKKYPLIVHVYEKFSDGLNAYRVPKWCNGPINIPYFVSNGYLVFTPDITYTIGSPLKSAVSAVLSGVEHLRKYKFIDFDKMGLQGNSFGAYETNYILTQTKIFKAASSSSGVVDLISFYGTKTDLGTNADRVESGQLRIGATLWEMPERYIANSPIFFANDIKTPLLLMHTSSDQNAPFAQAVEFFLALKKLHNPTWLLEYKHGNHAVSGKFAIDYTTRMLGFFNHYLMGYARPNWMSNKPFQN